MKDRNIKLNTILVSALIIIVLIFGITSIIIENSNVVHSESEMLQFIKEDQKISGELTVIEAFYAENKADDNRLPAYDKLLLVCKAEGSNSDNFIAAQFNVVGENEYKFDRYEKLDESQANFFRGHWGNNYIVVCNEPDAVRYECEIDGVLQEGNIISLPKVFMVEYEENCRLDIFDADREQLY